MNQRSVEDKFERAWLSKFSSGVKELMGEDLNNKIMEGSENLLNIKDRIDWTENAMEILDFHVTDENKRDIMNRCACVYHFPELLDQYKQWYIEETDVKILHARMKKDFEKRIIKTLLDKGVDDDFIKLVIQENWGVIGRMEGDKIIVTKMPANLQQYLAATTKEARDYAYCHCPRIKDVFLYEKKNISSTYCYCGGGFYTSLWESILGKPVDIKLMKSLLDGDNTCSFEITLPTL